MLKRTSIFLLGVAALTVYGDGADQSQADFVNNQPIGEPGNVVSHPEVVLQLKYDRGALERIYLAQFRQRGWNPSVPTRSNLCSDLCHAGLGGEGCGPVCKDLVPVGLQAALMQTHNSSERYGEPRSAVCPTLCSNRLGYPLCNCLSTLDVTAEINWEDICKTFCLSDRYILGGCPACDTQTTSPTVEIVGIHPRLLSASEGWSAWCNIQCRQGQGGAACNCDRTPFQ